MSSESQPDSEERARQQVRDRVQWPAMFLVANAALNLLVALLQTTHLVSAAIAPADEAANFERELLQRLGGQPSPPLVGTRRVQPPHTDPEALKRRTLFAEAVLAFLLLLPALLALAGGVRMYQMRGYPLAVVGSLASAVPCLSPMTCCCIGEVVGVWCVVVLLQPLVREAFS